MPVRGSQRVSHVFDIYILYIHSFIHSFMNDCPIKTFIYLPLAAGCAGISSVAAVNSQNVSFDIRVPGEQLEAHATRKLVIRE